jgi:hypothetical protein
MRRTLGIIGLASVIAGLSLQAVGKGPDAGGYSATDAAVYSFVDLTAGGGAVSVLSGTDDGVVPLALPFPFYFYGQTYNAVCASANGALYFLTRIADCKDVNDFANVDLSAVPGPDDRPGLFPFWSDLTFQVPGAGGVLYRTLGTAGTRRFIVQWQDAYPQGSDNPVTFQVVLSEGSNKILYQYRTVSLGAGNPATQGARATVGVRNAGAVALQQFLAWSFNAPVLSDASVIQITSAQSRIVGDVNGDGAATCADLAIVTASMGKRAGQTGFDARADVNGDKVVNVSDLTTVSRALPTGTRCP